MAIKREDQNGMMHHRAVGPSMSLGDPILAFTAALGHPVDWTERTDNG